MKNNKEKQKIAKHLFEQSLSEGKIDEEKVLSMVKEIKNNYKSDRVQILEYYLKNLKKFISRNTILIQSPFLLDQNTIERIKMKFGKSLNTKNVVKADLLAGFKITIEDNQYDYSTKNKIKQLEEVAGV